MDIGRLLFLSVAFVTHAVVGYALVRGFTGVDQRTGAWLGLGFGFAPDADFLFPADWGWPFVHRGITHAPLFALAVVGGAYAVSRRRSVALAVALGLGSHIVIDSLSTMGVPWLFPLRLSWNAGLDVHGPIGTVLLWALSIGVLASRTDDVSWIT
ncbi:metal-dependent hydrolase [Natrinema altunense]|uniref:Membrane-bound metal-dependent hydrolase n=1 Tax=Natrinema altunense (strain JCM 12890 / CGMCC 1.3731 / AJ2) TaxID=1227494 RepID=L9ZLB0_NATA2|nr:metal-dependent hydrolase [Natrinema altunense]ELY85953.1 membrane-bound metal-dependent hydrolase [Natrinema altunense JCM 12890]